MTSNDKGWRAVCSLLMLKIDACCPGRFKGQHSKLYQRHLWFLPNRKCFSVHVLMSLLCSQESLLIQPPTSCFPHSFPHSLQGLYLIYFHYSVVYNPFLKIQFKLFSKENFTECFKNMFRKCKHNRFENSFLETLIHKKDGKDSVQWLGLGHLGIHWVWGKDRWSLGFVGLS